MVAYPLEGHTLVDRLGVHAKDLPKYLSVSFQGSDRTVVKREASLRVGVQELRAAFQWLLFNNWHWMEVTRHLPITIDFFGDALEETLSSSR